MPSEIMCNGKHCEEMELDKKVSLESAAVGRLLKIDSRFRALSEVFQTLTHGCMVSSTVELEYELADALTEAVRTGMSRSEIISLLPDAWAAHKESSFIKHLQDWPRGYAGDFEAVNMIVDMAENAPENSLSGVLGRVVLESSIARQHREKICIQAEAVERACERSASARILSIACGPSRDLERVMDRVENTGAKIFFVDSDSDALEDSLKRLDRIKGQVKACRADIRNIAGAIRSSGEVEFDLVYAGGLFDYLPGKLAKAILKRMAGLVDSDGELMFTNLKAGNPFKALMETMADWRLIERSGTEMMELQASTSLCSLSLKTDPTGLAWIATAKNG